MSEYIRELRSLVGTRPLILTGSVVIIQNDNDQILLQHRKDGNWGLSDPTESHEIRFFDMHDLPSLNPANTVYLSKYILKV
ncbi:hypothetical protein BVG16_12730 [Paenibacillus selenitireducens]|uniref:Nudix hydrolase domain-containing protein n=1 Tax=Paenibacillus selenitireducens TaxID=1324314 RepID=A0A1T2XFP4_9BACL|nr:hypothetical protein BVG16_12730 [Paenibacillus selenitireducens]